MTRLIWFNCFSGISGDMALGALIDAGADLTYIKDVLGLLNLRSWAIEPQKVDKSGLFATYANVAAEDDTEERSWSTIRSMLQSAELPERIKKRSLSVFTALARAEASIHRIPEDDIHFHEVGGIDAIVDIVGTCAALESLAIDVIYCSPVAIGSGTIRAAHGVFPNPAPATAELLKNADITGVNCQYELTTPTGAAIVSALSEKFGSAPDMRIDAVGYGAGKRDIEGAPNCVQVVVGHNLTGDKAETLVMLETNVDDITGEVLGHTINQLIGAGANDVWITPILMKKGRPAHTISVLTTTPLRSALIDLLQRETGSLGVRSWTVQRQAKPRHVDYVEVNGEAVRMKVSGVRAKAEFEDALGVARRQNRPVREVLNEIERAWSDLHD